MSLELELVIIFIFILNALKIRWLLFSKKQYLEKKTSPYIQASMVVSGWNCIISEDLLNV
jgi:hypothetical protein